jgi:hypothetical protein
MSATPIPALVLAVASVAAAVHAAEGRGAAIEMFGTSKADAAKIAWRAFCEDSQIDANGIWELDAGIVTLKAGHQGYLRTQEDFRDFILELQWRRPADKKASRGGVLLRMTGRDKIWPKSLEAQLNGGAAGDFWGLDGYQLNGPSDRLQKTNHDKFGSLINLKKTADAEKTPGQWNQYEIRAEGETVTLSVNGQVVNQAVGCDAAPGKICLTAEGDEIQFRNVRLTPLARNK